jgi:hypothetical protein
MGFASAIRRRRNGSPRRLPHLESVEPDELRSLYTEAIERLERTERELAEERSRVARLRAVLNPRTS